VILLISCREKVKYQYNTTDFRPELKKHIENIIAEGKLSYNPDTLALNFLEDSCTKEELLRLLNFENPLVRVWAYRTIIYRNEPDFFPILLSHLDDTAKVIWWYYDDAAGEFTVSDLMIRKAQEKRKLTQPLKDSLINEVLTKHIYLGTAEWMINDIQPKEKYYSIIKTAAQKKLSSCHDLSNTYSLARFKKQEDIPLIKKNFSEFTNNPFCNNNFFKAIEVFPDTVFFPILTKFFIEIIKKKKQHYSDDLKYYCRAVVKYKTQSSLDILTALSKKETYPDSWHFSSNQEHIFRAIHKNPSSIFDSLYITLKPQMSESVMKSIDNPDYDDKTTW